MYVPLKDFETDHELAIVENWVRGENSHFLGILGEEDCLGSIEGSFDYWEFDNLDLVTRITPEQALTIVKASELKT